MDNPERQEIKNEQSRETGNTEWTIQRDRQYRMDNPERQAIKNGQSRETGNIEYKTQNEDKPNIKKTKMMSNTDPTHVK
jgi:hypothetical protein